MLVCTFVCVWPFSYLSCCLASFSSDSARIASLDATIAGLQDQIAAYEKETVTLRDELARAKVLEGKAAPQPQLSEQSAEVDRLTAALENVKAQLAGARAEEERLARLLVDERTKGQQDVALLKGKVKELEARLMDVSVRWHAAQSRRVTVLSCAHHRQAVQVDLLRLQRLLGRSSALRHGSTLSLLSWGRPNSVTLFTLPDSR